MVAMRVCPFCGEPPGGGVFCEACGRNLSAVEQLPTREEWQASGPPSEAPGAPSLAPAPPPSIVPLAERCAVATAEFLAAMAAAGNPGTQRVPSGPSKAFRRAPTIDGWIVRAVDRDEDDLGSSRYTLGLFLSVDGTWHQLDNVVRGWGQRDFPQFHHTVEPEPIAAPADERIEDELAEVLRKQRVGRPA
jgi:hypothetical protein